MSNFAVKGAWMAAVGRGSSTFHWTGMKGKLEVQFFVAPAPIVA